MDKKMNSQEMNTNSNSAFRRVGVLAHHPGVGEKRRWWASTPTLRRLRRSGLAGFVLLAFFIQIGCANRETARAMGADAAAAGLLPAPDFTGASGWLNTDKPISINDLKGQVVVIDFWTYCCINCMHVFPDLKYLEDKYKDQPVVILGVHSGKFDEEKDAENIRAAVLRHNISHPVAVDNDYKIWNSYGVNSWPTLLVIDSRGLVVGQVSGEGHRADLDTAIAKLLEQGKKDGTLAKPLHFQSERSHFKSGELEFPGKVLADTAGQRLFISDTNHHRVLVTTLDGKETDIIGSGEMGLSDGAFADAKLHQPQGLALSSDGNTLYIADTENHAVRVANLKKKTLRTLAGTGEQSHDFHADGPSKTTPLSSPWDLSLVGDRLYVAMAGTHQIWLIDLSSHRTVRFAGSGREGASEDTAADAAFAQPSGLASDGKHLYVAASEASCVQDINLSDGSVHLLAGSGDLFGFGSADGVGSAARFQHPLGVALSSDGKTLYVADSFNNLVRKINIADHSVKTFAGTGKSDPGDPAAIGFFEPGGLSIGGDLLYVADTNHHRIVAVPLSGNDKPVILDVRK
jgi:DNA-binding beta-propeller fold protein YncE